MTSPPPPDTPAPAPLSWADLPDLFVRPTRFFHSVRLDQGAGWLLAAVLVGISGAIGRIDQRLIAAELDGGGGGSGILESIMMESWTAYWLGVVVAGAVGAVVIWFLGGWWYNVRLRWSGADDHDRRQGRLVYTLSGLVSAIPSLAYSLGTTLVFPDYRAAWESEELWSTALVVFPFWAAFVSYRGVRSRFPVRPGGARFWFLIMPVLAYAIIFGIISVLYGTLGGEPAGTPV
jgi:hypothetical protein